MLEAVFMAGHGGGRKKSDSQTRIFPGEPMSFGVLFIIYLSIVVCKIRLCLIFVSERENINEKRNLLRKVQSFY